MFTTDELNRISKTLEENISSHSNKQYSSHGKNEDNYYVYMLATKNADDIRPFYIGKGKGTRVFQHENDAEEIIKSIEETGEASLDKEVSDKIKAIINNRGEIVKYIIKWGLTSQEAFMCESSLINMYSSISPDALTNIQNGHASDKEKNSRVHTTKAFEISDFLKDVCIEEVFYEDTTLVHKKVIFIQIKNALDNYEKDCRTEKKHINYNDYVYQCAQGYWHYKLDKANLADYVIALQNTVVRGIYPLAKWMTLEELRNRNDAPTYPIADKKDVHNSNDPKVLKRIGFYKMDEKDLSDAQQSELKLLKSQLLNKLIKEKNKNPDDKDWFKEQNSVYNYDVKKQDVLIRTTLRK